MGFAAGVEGWEWIDQCVAQAQRHGAILMDRSPVERIVRMDDGFAVYTNKKHYNAKTVILAVGMQNRRLEIPGADQTPIHYEAGRDAADREAGKRVLVVGGGNSAAQAALHINQSARWVTMVMKHSIEDGMSAYLIKRLRASKHLSIIEDTTPISIDGNGATHYVRFDTAEGDRFDSIYSFIGFRPVTKWLAHLVVLDRDGFIKHDHGKTATPGIVVAGDAGVGRPRNITMAMAAGGVAVMQVREHLARVARI